LCRNTLYGKNPKYFKTPTFSYFHGEKKICSQNQCGKNFEKKILYEKILTKI